MVIRDGCAVTMVMRDAGNHGDAGFTVTMAMLTPAGVHHPGPGGHAHPASELLPLGAQRGAGGLRLPGEDPALPSAAQPGPAGLL